MTRYRVDFVIEAENANWVMENLATIPGIQNVVVEEARSARPQQFATGGVVRGDTLPAPANGSVYTKDEVTKIGKEGLDALQGKYNRGVVTYPPRTGAEVFVKIDTDAITRATTSTYSPKSV